jgi:surfeit locus 1 family protein
MHIALNQQQDLRFYRTNLKGRFDNDHIFLLDNKIFHRQVGYEVYIPFTLSESGLTILVDRGFVPITLNRHDLPTLTPIPSETSLSGMLNLPPTYFSFGSIEDKNATRWPLRIEYINLNTLGKLIGHPLFPYILTLNPTHPASYPIEWQIIIMSPERHLGYACQWFALAFTLLILFVALNIERDVKKGET